MHGRGAILRIDLSSEKITKEAISPELCQKYIGGEGINTRLFWEHFLRVDPKIDPTSPENVIIWGLGPLGGTAYGGGSKSVWTFKGPATGIFGDSKTGGTFGPQMRWAGYDHMVITGRARHPVYIWVNNDDVELRDASHIWGKKISETEDAIQEELGNGEAGTACIGPAGENLVTYAGLIHSRYRAAGRMGAGCVFGSKNLKAVAARGSKGISVYDRRAFYKAIETLLPVMKEYPHWAVGGTLSIVKSAHDRGTLPFHNGQRGVSPEIDKLTSDWYLNNMQQRFISCSPGCAAACQGWHYIKGNESPLARKWVGERGQRPEFAHVLQIGTNWDIRDLPTVSHLCEVLNEYGFDIIQTAFTISFLMELWQRGIVTEKDMVEWTGEPLSLEWGDYEAMEKLLDFIALQKNQLGKMLREPGPKAAKKIEALKGIPLLQYANYGKAGSPQNQIMRPTPGLGLAVSTSAIGGHHLKGGSIDEKASMRHLGRPDAGNPNIWTLKGAGIKWGESYSCMYNSLGVCKFAGGVLGRVSERPPELFPLALYALTGMEITPEELLIAGERIANIQKAFNSRLGLRREDDSCCDRWMYEPAPDGPNKGMKLADGLEAGKDEYYEAHGWDKATSLQKREKLEELGLSDIIKVLEKEGAVV